MSSHCPYRRRPVWVLRGFTLRTQGANVAVLPLCQKRNGIIARQSSLHIPGELISCQTQLWHLREEDREGGVQKRMLLRRAGIHGLAGLCHDADVHFTRSSALYTAEWMLKLNTTLRLVGWSEK